MATNEEILGRDGVNDLEAILAITNQEVGEVIHAVEDQADAIFTWDYEKGQRPALNKLYEKAKTSQWNGETDLPWDTEVPGMLHNFSFCVPKENNKRSPNVAPLY